MSSTFLELLIQFLEVSLLIIKLMNLDGFCKICKCTPKFVCLTRFSSVGYTYISHFEAYVLAQRDFMLGFVVDVLRAQHFL
jgi:hypothetical protein